MVAQSCAHLTAARSRRWTDLQITQPAPTEVASLTCALSHLLPAAHRLREKSKMKLWRDYFRGEHTIPALDLARSPGHASSDELVQVLIHLHTRFPSPQCTAATSH